MSYADWHLYRKILCARSMTMGSRWGNYYSFGSLLGALFFAVWPLWAASPSPFCPSHYWEWGYLFPLCPLGVGR